MREEQFLEEVQYFNSQLSAVIGQKIKCESNKILADALNYIRDTGGKRLRPIICILSAEAVGGSRDKAVSTAIAIELLHNATLVHDDVIDENYVRRKNLSNPARYGEKRAIVIGDLLLGLSCEMLGRCGEPEVMRLVTRAISDIAMGQYLEFTLRLRDLTEATEQLYMEIAELKTASAFMASAEAGAILGCGSEIESENLRNYGKSLGIAYQIQDDVLDICGDPEKTGKSVGLDIKNGERTILVIHALNNSSQAEKAYVEEILMKKREAGSSEIDRVRGILINSHAINYAITLSNELVQGAKNSIEGLENTEAKRKLQLIADLAAQRIEEQAQDTFIDR